MIVDNISQNEGEALTLEKSMPRRSETSHTEKVSMHTEHSDDPLHFCHAV
jgi:hypothetical protein